MLSAVREAEAIINCQRKVPLKIEAHFYFVEKKKSNFKSLKESIADSEWKDEIGNTIILYNDDFATVAQDIVKKTKIRHPRGGTRVIFFLDQCGYSQVHASLIAKISASLDYKSEFILNFACEWLATYIHDGEKFGKSYDNVGISDLLPVDKLAQLKKEHQFDYRYIVASQIGPALKEATRAKFFSPFYVEPANGSNHGYWLVHLAPVARARNAMMDVYYQKQNYIRAFGNTGLRMLAFKPDLDPTGYFKGFELNTTTIQQAIDHISYDIAKEFTDHKKGSTNFGEFYHDKTNDTIANKKTLSDSILRLAKSGELDVFGPGGGDKKTESINDNDIITLNQRPFLPGLSSERNGKLSG